MDIIGIDFRGNKNDESVYVKSKIIDGKLHVIETGDVEDLTTYDLIGRKLVGESEDLERFFEALKNKEIQ